MTVQFSCKKKKKCFKEPWLTRLEKTFKSGLFVWVMTSLARFAIAHVQKEWEPGARVGARLNYGVCGEARAFVFNFVLPRQRSTSFPGSLSFSSLVVQDWRESLGPRLANDPITERAPPLAPGFHSFWKWAIQCILSFWADPLPQEPRVQDKIEGLRGGGRGRLLSKKDMDGRRKSRIKSIKETNVGVAQAVLTP